MPTSVSEVEVFYDRPRDVLYLTVGDRVPCVSVEDLDIEGLHYRYSLQDNSLNGVTIVWFSLQDKARLYEKIPFPVTLP